MNIWVVGTSNQLLITGSYSILKQNFQKNKLDAGKTVFFVIGQFYNSHSICLNSFWEGYVFAWICYPFNCKAFNCKTVHYFFTEKVFIFQKICFKVYWKSSKFPFIVAAWVLIPPSEPQPSNFFCPPKHWKFSSLCIFIEYQNTNENNQIRYFLKNIFWLKYFPVTTNCRSQHLWVFFAKAVLKIS